MNQVVDTPETAAAAAALNGLPVAQIRSELDRALTLDPLNARAHYQRGLWNRRLATLGLWDRALSKVTFAGLPHGGTPDQVQRPHDTGQPPFELRIVEARMPAKPSRRVSIFQIGRCGLGR